MERFDRIGGIFLIAGSLLFGLIHLAIAMYIPNVEATISFQHLWATLWAIHGFVPYILSFIFMLLGIYFIFFKEGKELNEQKASIDKISL
ncbi:hypothetical protein [Alkalihalobacillus pseudalcaliphilus]|uniref:hypothetical protein n=1 Tax=Alkalihalobacillus pseudalcaliphilus TaxID=79884 RepID=UPI00064DD067|nr:hypothetical protein [Alkalihalobacillus pseudalcaliphilus]KMK78126.1 hypothetical protein AB990_01385 [Alkalihalobacillus pseudalcaliphilus]